MKDIFDVIKHKSFADLSIDELKEIKLLDLDESGFNKMKVVLNEINDLNAPEEISNTELLESLDDLFDEKLKFNRKRKIRNLVLSLSTAAVFVLLFFLPIRFNKLQEDSEYFHDELFVDSLIQDSTIFEKEAWE